MPLFTKSKNCNSCDALWDMNLRWSKKGLKQKCVVKFKNLCSVQHLAKNVQVSLILSTLKTFSLDTNPQVKTTFAQSGSM